MSRLRLLCGPTDLTLSGGVMTLFDKLSDYSVSGVLPMHMPGHKRNTGEYPWLAGTAGLDITEIDGFDNLNDPEGLFSDLECRAARLWGAGESIALTGGSTLGILACVLAVLEGGGELLMCRASHRSVYHAAQLAGANTRYLTPTADRSIGIPLSVTPDEVDAALKEHPQVRLVCVTSPTYEGVISDIASIVRVCHGHGVPLLVDEAHGAHLGFGGFPRGAVGFGADITVQSLHKTLPSLTQTAIAHINPGLTDPKRVRRYVTMLQTSSPSYLLSASIDGCVDYMERRGRDAAARWLAALSEFREKVSGLKNICLWTGPEGVFASDPSKLLVCGNGEYLESGLRRLGIEPEYAAHTHVLCMTGMGDTPETLSRLAAALVSLDARAPASPALLPPSPLPGFVLPIYEAVRLPGSSVPLERAVGRVSGEYVWSYPPGVPLIAPGEAVDEGVIRAVRTARNLHSSYKQVPKSIFCVDLM